MTAVVVDFGSIPFPDLAGLTIVEKQFALKWWQKGALAAAPVVHRQGLATGTDFGISQGMLKVKDWIEKEAHRGK